MEFLKLIQQTVPKNNGLAGMKVLRRGIALTFPNFKRSKGEDSIPRMRHRLNQIINDETFETRSKAIEALDKHNIDRVAHKATKCIAESSDLPRMKRCIEKAQGKIHYIDDPKLRHRMMDTLDKSHNVIPRK